MSYKLLSLSVVPNSSTMEVTDTTPQVFTAQTNYSNSFSSIEKQKRLRVRHGQAVLTFFGLFLAYSMRANLSVGIVAMTSTKGSNPDYPVLHWSLSQQGIISSSFFWGYLILQIPAGHLAHKLGPKYLLLGAMVVCSLATLVLPVCATKSNWIVVCVTRVINGLAQGFFYPCTNAHVGKWAPPLEKSRIFSFVFGGTQLGTVVTMFVAGYLAASPWGWPSIFYVTGACGLLWAAVWLYLGADSPDTHSSISAAEKAYIKATLVNNSDKSSTMVTPWQEIVTSVPLWALLATHQGYNWGFWLLLTLMPNYMSHVLGFDIKSNGLVSSLPYVVVWVLIIVFSWTADFINNKRLLPISFTRKMWNSIALWGGAAALVALSLVTSVAGAVTLLALSVGLTAGAFTGFFMNHLDLAPNFAGLLMGITNGLANIASILSPLITGFVVQDETSKDQWMIAFYIAAAIMFVCNFIFVLFGSTEVQPWNEPKNEI